MMNVSANLFTAKYTNSKCFNKTISSSENQFGSKSSLKKDNYNLENDKEIYKNEAPKIKHDECEKIQQSPKKTNKTEFLSTPLNVIYVNETKPLALITPNVSWNQSHPEVTPLKKNMIDEGTFKDETGDDKTDITSDVRRSLATEMLDPNEAIPTSINSQMKHKESKLISPSSLMGPKIKTNSNVLNNDSFSLNKINIKIEDQHSPIRIKEKKCHPSEKEITKKEHNLNENTPKKEKSFPEIVYNMVTETALKNPEILTWIENGEAFIIRDTVSMNSNKVNFLSIMFPPHMKIKTSNFLEFYFDIKR